MSFLKIADPVKREQIVKEFLAIKNNIRANELVEKTGKIELREDLSEFFKPVTETQKETQKETREAITKGLEPIRTGIEELPRRLPREGCHEKEGHFWCEKLEQKSLLFFLLVIPLR